MCFERNGRSANRFWILCTICALLLGICFDSLQADSSLAYRDLADTTAEMAVPDASDAGKAADTAVQCTAGTEAVFPGDRDAGAAFPGVSHTGTERSALCASQRGIPVQQAYVSESSCQGNNALVPRRTAKRTSSRGICGDIFGVLSAGELSFGLFSGRIALFTDGLCEVISNTVILHYIHGQDGEKA